MTTGMSVATVVLITQISVSAVEIDSRLVPVMLGHHEDVEEAYPNLCPSGCRLSGEDQDCGLGESEGSWWM